MADDIRPDDFRRTLAKYPTGVVIVTGSKDGTPSGLAVGTFTSVSLDPPLVGFLPSKSSTSWPQIEESGAFCVNVLAADQLETCQAFAMSGVDKYASISWRSGPSDMPVIDGVIAWIACDIERVEDMGDHWFVLGRVVELTVERHDAMPLVFFGGGYGMFAELGSH